MESVDVDARGRIYLPKHLREEYGRKFRVVRMENGIKLIPIDDDPVEGLRDSMGELSDVDISEIDETVEEKMEEQVGE